MGRGVHDWWKLCSMFKDAGMSAEPCNFNLGPNCIQCGYCEAGCGREGTAKITLTSALLRPALATKKS